ncbi:VWA domain-containing protein [Pigmentiphaga soli]|uniref:VWA domain-containing protein n=1 Tax=Pigmentiphaga soli TaxID=1007095 RepID=A0ABP8GQ00_9BURK
MLIDFFYHLRRHQLPVSIQEYLALLEALGRQVIAPSLDEFYLLARIALIKDETLFDRYDLAFGSYYRGIAAAFPPGKEIPLDWLVKRLARDLSDADKAAIEKLGWDKLMELFRQRLEEQRERHEGGSKWIGTGGTSPFGNGGYHPEGIRIGGDDDGRDQRERGNGAARAWDARSFRDYDDGVELGTRNIKVALRRLRRFAREGAEHELDLDGTIRQTARNAGWLDLRMVPQRRNAVKVLMLLDVGGTMDSHVQRVEELFSAARSEFRNLEVFYFHNCLYEWLWKSGRRRHAERFHTWDVLRTYNPDWRLIFVGDATMSPYEILQPGGSVEYNNAEAGAAWLQRMTAAFPRFAWLNPEPEGLWNYRQSVDIIRRIVQGRMYPVTLSGLEQAMRLLSK